MTEVLSILIADFLQPLQSNHQSIHIPPPPAAVLISASAKIVIKLVRNALRENVDDTFRKIRLSNKIIQEKVVKVPRAVDLLTAVGFVYCELDGEKYLIFVPDDNNMTMGNLFCTILEEQLSKVQIVKPTMEKDKTVKSPLRKVDDKNENPFLSEKERKERSLKIIQAKRERKIQKEREKKRWAENKEVRSEKKKYTEASKRTDAAADIGNDHVQQACVLSRTNILRLQRLNEMKRKAAVIQNDERNYVSDQSVDVDMKEGDTLEDSDMVEDQKPAAKPAPASDESLKSWAEFLKSVPRCGPASGIRDTSVYYKDSQSTGTASVPSPACFKRIFSEFRELESSLPQDKNCSIWVRFDEEMPQYIRAIVTAPLPGPSPYAGGVFAFDVHVPDNYPKSPPKVQLLTTGRGTVRFGPNLYKEGKVCLSLLGTWSGPKWNPKISTLHQVLVSIQSLVLGVEHPYYLEPGHGGWEDTVKEGDFASVGKTLAGETVKEDLTLPPRVWEYEDKIRVATCKFAMLEPLEMIEGGGKKVKPALVHLSAFAEVIAAHFFCNQAEVLDVVKGWANAARPSSMQPFSMDPLDHAPPQHRDYEQSTPCPSHYATSLNELFHRIENKMPSELVMNESVSSKSSIKESGEDKVPANTLKQEPLQEEVQDVKIEQLTMDQSRLQLQIAVQEKNFILAGQLQKHMQYIQEIEEYNREVADLKDSMNAAASVGDYIKAGELQAKLKKLEEQEKKSFQSYTSNDHNLESPHDEDFVETENFDDVMDESNSDDEVMDDWNISKSYGWGSGHVLHGESSAGRSATTQSTKEADTSKAKSNADASIARTPIKDPCRLRIRLPGPEGESFLEHFDTTEKLSVVYKVVNSKIPSDLLNHNKSTSPKLVQFKGISNKNGHQCIGVSGGAFANPLSEFGFTLLSVRPKREYSLEMNGTSSLKELGMVPSASLTVMMCASRGQVKRGDLESKLSQAQGDAMDVEDLGYEALQELGEKIGFAAPGDGDWKGIDNLTLEKVSTVLSPKILLMRKSGSKSEIEGTPKCPICLGEFDPTDSNMNLRTLNFCNHTFHSSCLQTWLTTKTSCPVCKHSLAEE